MPEQNRVVLEIARKKSFASALDWPGWCRPGSTAEESLQVLADYAPRYQIVAGLAGYGGIQEIAEDLDVIEKLEGDPTTEFGAPNIHAAAEDAFMTTEECERQLALLQACWTFFDDVAARVSEELQKGPRGGGRNRTDIINHVNEAQRYYVTQLGVRAKKGSLITDEAISAHHEAIIVALREHNRNQQHPRWPLRYVIRRAAWHVLDHAWEMEDKDLTGKEG